MTEKRQAAEIKLVLKYAGAKRKIEKLWNSENVYRAYQKARRKKIWEKKKNGYA